MNQQLTAGTWGGVNHAQALQQSASRILPGVLLSIEKHLGAQANVAQAQNPS